ncbi:hypothetical protein BASA62_008496 [Batrachochytrium salamandrivorans]|nr:hypothetical protein BASA62_008496 [Batrachochytrium salamandrivorans]
MQMRTRVNLQGPGLKHARAIGAQQQSIMSRCDKVISSANTDSSIGLVKRSPNEEDDSSDPHALEREVEAMKSRVESLGSQIAQLKHNYCGVKHSLVIVCKNSVAVQNMLDKEQNPEKQVVLAKKIKKMERLKQKYKDELDGISKFINDVSASYTHLKQNFERIGATPSTHLYVDEQLDPKTYTCGTERYEYYGISRVWHVGCF